MIGYILVGFACLFAGVFVHQRWDEIKDSVEEAKGRLPDAEMRQIAWATKIWPFLRKFGLFILVGLIIVGIVLSSLIAEANRIPTIKLGINSLKDGCSNVVNVEVTLTDVDRGVLTFGPKGCQRLINLTPANGQDSH